jgi:hypothetical protein
MIIRIGLSGYAAPAGAAASNKKIGNIDARIVYSRPASTTPRQIASNSAKVK